MNVEFKHLSGSCFTYEMQSYIYLINLSYQIKSMKEQKPKACITMREFNFIDSLPIKQAVFIWP